MQLTRTGRVHSGNDIEAIPAKNILFLSKIASCTECSSFGLHTKVLHKKVKALKQPLIPQPTYILHLNPTLYLWASEHAPPSCLLRRRVLHSLTQQKSMQSETGRPHGSSFGTSTMAEWTCAMVDLRRPKAQARPCWQALLAGFSATSSSGLKGLETFCLTPQERLSVLFGGFANEIKWANQKYINLKNR